MTGAGEACSHVGSTLFAIEAILRIRDSSTCTQKEDTWLPAYTQSVDYKSIREIDFSSARSKKNRLQSCREEEITAHTKQPIPEPSEDELTKLYDICSAAEGKPSLLLMIEGRNDVFSLRKPGNQAYCEDFFHKKHSPRHSTSSLNVQRHFLRISLSVLPW